MDTEELPNTPRRSGRPRVATAFRDLAWLTGSSLRHGRGPVRIVALASAAGTIIFVLAMGIGQSSSARVEARFIDALPRLVSGRLAQSLEQRPYAGLESRFPRQGIRAARDLPAVDELAAYSTAANVPIGFTNPILNDVPLEADADVVGVTPQFWDVVRPTIEGRPAPQSSVPVPGVVIGIALMNRINAIDPAATTLIVGGVEHPIVGVAADLDRFPQANLSLIMNDASFDATFDQRTEITSGFIATVRRGTASEVASVIAQTLRPDAPAQVDVVRPFEPNRLRRNVGTDASGTAQAVGLIGIAAAVFGISNALSLAAMQRRSEIGLRRALGSSSAAILCQLLVEAAVIGMMGAIAGSFVGVVTLHVWARAANWQPVIDPRVPWIAIAIGTAAALLGALLPAIAASRTEPSDALRA